MKLSNTPNQTNTADSQANLDKSPFTSSRSSITTMVEPNRSSNLMANLGTVIPQLDDSLNSLPPDSQTVSYEDQITPQHQPSHKSLQCETCHQTFETEDQFNYHDNAHQLCCVECFIFYTTQVMANLHDLEIHPNTHYANRYIPESTKLLFASGQPKNQPMI
jgi:hypothetical protein